MELKAMFPNLNVLWTRWSAYQIKPHQWGGEYLTPAKGATDLTYNCAEQPGPLVADALDLGRQLLCRFCGPLRALGSECREGGRGHGRPQCTPVLPPVEQLGIW